MQRLFFSLSFLAIVHAGCSQQKDTAPVVKPTNPQQVSYTTQDATQAYNSFNTAFYSTSDKLYYSTTEKKDLGAIWTQAIYWDMAMDAYKRTNDAAYLQRVTDIYQGGLTKYDQYN